MSGRRLFRFWRTDPSRDVDDEIRFHLDAAAAEERAAGRSPSDAEHAAVRRFGNVPIVAADLRQLSLAGERIVQRREWFGALVQDARFGLRQLRKSPGFTVVAMLTLALGIGANTAIFSLIDSVLLRPLGFAEPTRLFDLRPLTPEGDAHFQVAVPNYLAWANGSKLFAAIGGTTTHSFTLTGSGEPQRLSGLRASAPYWRALESPPVLGRYFTAAEDREGGPRVVVISQALFRGAFGGDPSIVGRVIHLDEMPYTVIGVASPAYGPVAGDVALWVPLDATAQERIAYGDHEVLVTGRLRPGVTLDAAVAELRGFERDVQQAHPDDGYTGQIVARNAVAALVGDTAQRQFLVLLGAVGLVLLIACGNVANLLLARAVTRRGEIAVRSALGANRGRIVGQMLVESGVLALGGAILGTLAGAAILRVLVASAPQNIPRIGAATINGHVLAFTIALAVVAGLLFGVVPAWRASRTDLQSTLRASGRDGRTGSDPLRGALVVAEIAVALVLLTGAGLLIRSAAAMQREELGFNAAHLLTTRISLPIAHYGDSSVSATYTRILAGVRAIPGVTSAAMISRMPIGGHGADCMVTAPGTTPAGSNGIDAQFRSVSPEYFKTIGTPILRGRPLDATDVTGSPLVVVINAHLAQSLFHGRDPIGQQVRHCIGINDGYDHVAPRTVVGVAADVRADGVNSDIADQVYYPYTQFFERTTALIVRTPGDPLALVAGVRRAVAAVDPLLPLARTADMESIIHDSTASPRFTMLLLTLLGLTGLVLAAVGIYGVISYQVGQRTREIGVRLALGATPATVRRMVVREALLVAAIGVVTGEVVALLAARTLAGLIYGVSTSDPMTFASVGVLLALTAIVASAVPAFRATRIDPVTALRG